MAFLRVSICFRRFRWVIRGARSIKTPFGPPFRETVSKLAQNCRKLKFHMLFQSTVPLSIEILQNIAKQEICNRPVLHSCWFRTFNVVTTSLGPEFSGMQMKQKTERETVIRGPTTIDRECFCRCVLF